MNVVSERIALADYIAIAAVMWYELVKLAGYIKRHRRV
jgi:hypothetical protein